MPENGTFPNPIDHLSEKGLLYTLEEDGFIRCTACALRCRLRPGQQGSCKVRYNRGGELRVPWGYVSAIQVDPIEKKPFFHFMPGSEVLTFGMLGCNFHCSFCQNWSISQTFRDPVAATGMQSIRKMSAENVVSIGKQTGVKIIASSYNEPLISSEWAAAIFEPARQAGMLCAYVSNGHATPEALEFLKPYLNAIKIDLKSMSQENYQKMGGRLDHVLETIHFAHQLGIWVEVVTLVIPGFNDSVEELWEIARFVASINSDIPWHVTAYHPDYRMGNPATPTGALKMAGDIGQEAGLHFVYAGNLPGKVGSLEDTFCPSCQTRLIQRKAYSIIDYQITPSGTCPNCNTKIAGIWSKHPQNKFSGQE